jgi:hypothetical protein
MFVLVPSLCTSAGAIPKKYRLGDQRLVQRPRRDEFLTRFAIPPAVAQKHAEEPEQALTDALRMGSGIRQLHEESRRLGVPRIISEAFSSTCGTVQNRKDAPLTLGPAPLTRRF